jgi:hypothetical protein
LFGKDELKLKHGQIFPHPAEALTLTQETFFLTVLCSAGEERLGRIYIYIFKQP